MRLPFWTHVRDANISQDLREKFELLGEDVIAMAIAGAITTNVFLNVVYQNHDQAVAWLKERRDEHELRQDRLETAEWLILLFVVVGVILDIVIIFHLASDSN
jgi:hypothetical protein